MLVTDLHHFLDMSESAPGPARRLAAQLGDLVRAATAGPAGAVWVSALRCPRRPGHRRCPGRMVLARPGPAAPIRWRCDGCGDEGVISNWQDSPFDLRRRWLTPVDTGGGIVVSDATAAALREAPFLDSEAERVVFGMRADGGGRSYRPPRRSWRS